MRRSHIHAAIVLAVAFIAISATVLGFWLYATPHGAGGALKADGPTLFQALASVNQSVKNVTGGPWSLFSAWGVAAQAPFSPNVLGYYPRENVTVNSCGQEFNGLTLWNGSIPLFTGTFASGTAPFWQFGFLSNSSQEIVVATDVAGVVTALPPIPYPASDNPCFPWYDFYPNPVHWAGWISQHPADSSAAAAAAWAAVDQNAVVKPGPTVEIMTMGPDVFSAFNDVASGYGVYFDRCGVVNVAGVQPQPTVAVSSNGIVTSVVNATTICAVPNSGHHAADGMYDLVLNATTTTWGETIQALLPFQVGLAAPNGTVVLDYDGWGLANWMVALNVTSSSGHPLPIGSPNCAKWVLGLDQCPANLTGWYAVLTSSSGEWLNDYGLSSTGIGWSVPVDALVSHQQLTIVLPISWAVSGDNLVVSSTVSTSTIRGSVGL